MTKKELLDRCARNSEERILLGRVLDKLELAQNRSIPAHTSFLSPGEQASVTDLLSAWGRPRHLFWGGFSHAERQICVFLPDWQEPEDFLADPEGPLSALEAKFPANASLSHRDILGSLMGLGITREKLGDILFPAPGLCQVVALTETMPILLSQWEGAGRWKVRLSPVPLQSRRSHLGGQGGPQPPGVPEGGQAGGGGGYPHLPWTGQMCGPGGPGPVPEGPHHAGAGALHLSAIPLFTGGNDL